MKRLMFLLATVCISILFISCGISRKAPLTSKMYDGAAKNNILLKEVLIENKPVLNLKYDEVINYWGVPKHIRKIKVKFPADTEQNYIYLLCYDGIEIEMYPVLEGVDVQKTTTFRFDITRDQFEFQGIRVGMDKSKFTSKYKDAHEYAVSDIIRCHDEIGIPQSIHKVLSDLKEPDYYSSYENVFYLPGALVDEKGNITGAIGFAVLTKGNKIVRIVYGLPTGG